MLHGRLVPWSLLAGLSIAAGIAVAFMVAMPTPAQPMTSTGQDDSVEGLGCRGLPLRERAAQVLVVGLPGVTDADHPMVAEVLDAGVGGLLLTQENVQDEWQVRRLVGSLRRGSEHGLLVATDEEPGRVSSFGRLLGRTSSARTLAARDEEAAVFQLGRDTGAALADLGVDVVFAPVVDLDDGPARGVIGDRSFSPDPRVAARFARRYAAGLVAGGVQPTAKHFPGHGRTAVDSHRRTAMVDASLRELRSTDLVPFADQISAGVPLIMTAHVTYEALDGELPASLAPATYELLRAMGFEGVAITDSTGMGAVHQRWDFATSTVMAIRAGADAVLATDGQQARVMRRALVAAVRAGDLDEDRLNEAAGRVLALKGQDARALVCRDVPPVPQMRPFSSRPPR